MSTTHLLYLHGFRSSPQSAKARQMAAHVASQHPRVHWWCPQLPPSPQEAMALVSAGIADWPHASMAVVGSSLGGYYASWVAQQTGCPSVLLNPATQPANTLERYIGEQTAWHDPAERFFFRAEFVDEGLAVFRRNRMGEAADVEGRNAGRHVLGFVVGGWWLVERGLAFQQPRTTNHQPGFMSPPP